MGFLFKEENEEKQKLIREYNLLREDVLEPQLQNVGYQHRSYRWLPFGCSGTSYIEFSIALFVAAFGRCRFYSTRYLGENFSDRLQSNNRIREATQHHWSNQNV